MPLRIGDSFAGYRVLRLLGSGGMGDVYVVQHPRLPRQEALKVLRSDLSSDASFRERFIREADLAAGLRHPHIVGVHDRGEHEGHLWITMDHIDGTDAAQLMQQRYPAGMPFEIALSIITAVASALDYAHKRGLLHRDVKPANIIVADAEGEEPSVYLADFGIARPLDDISGITTTNMTIGTVAYAAPEQLMGEQMDGRADQYALAATGYHLLTGLQLFPNSNPAVVISRHLNTNPPALSERRPDCADLDDVFRLALAKDPHKRFVSCSAFAQALVDEDVGRSAAFANATTRAAPRPPGSAPPTADESSGKPAAGSRRGLVVLSGVAAILLLLGAAALAWHPWDRQRSNSAAATSTSVPSSTAPPGTATPPTLASTPPTVQPITTTTTTPEIPRAGFFGEWGQHSMAVTLVPDGSAYYKVWSGVANGASWSATWSPMTSSTAMIVLTMQSESHGEIDYHLHRYPGEAFTFTLQPDGYATITTPSGQPMTLCPRGAGFRDTEGLCGA
ncbi:serine/threonine-protein kinase [Mycobacterium sp. 2YAF39]|uniref:serine/threonine-protein kinase n=1 Tax=Mycobacterium sp. 2YAF39 TaxID=3233033 RepID=UPI003F9CB4AF